MADQRFERAVPLLDATDQGIGWPDPVDGPFFIVGHWVDLDGRPECVGLEVWKGGVNLAGNKFARFKGASRSGLGGTDLRSLPLATILRELWGVQARADARWRWDVVRRAVDRIAKLYRDDPGLAEEAAPLLLQEIPDAAFTDEDRTRRIVTDDLLREVADLYKAALRDPERRRSPTVAVQEGLTVSHSTATKYVARARERGFLPLTSPGRPSDLSPERK